MSGAISPEQQVLAKYPWATDLVLGHAPWRVIDALLNGFLGLPAPSRTPMNGVTCLMQHAFYSKFLLPDSRVFGDVQHSLTRLFDLSHITLKSIESFHEAEHGLIQLPVGIEATHGIFHQVHAAFIKLGETVVFVLANRGFRSGVAKVQSWHVGSPEEITVANCHCLLTGLLLEKEVSSPSVDSAKLLKRFDLGNCQDILPGKCSQKNGNCLFVAANFQLVLAKTLAEMQSLKSTCVEDFKRIFARVVFEIKAFRSEQASKCLTALTDSASILINRDCDPHEIARLFATMENICLQMMKADKSAKLYRHEHLILIARVLDQYDETKGDVLAFLRENHCPLLAGFFELSSVETESLHIYFGKTHFDLEIPLAQSTPIEDLPRSELVSQDSCLSMALKRPGSPELDRLVASLKGTGEHPLLGAKAGGYSNLGNAFFYKHWALFSEAMAELKTKNAERQLALISLLINDLKLITQFQDLQVEAMTFILKELSPFINNQAAFNSMLDWADAAIEQGCLNIINALLPAIQLIHSNGARDSAFFNPAAWMHKVIATGQLDVFNAVKGHVPDDLSEEELETTQGESLHHLAIESGSVEVFKALGPCRDDSVNKWGESLFLLAVESEDAEMILAVLDCLGACSDSENMVGVDPCLLLHLQFDDGDISVTDQARILAKLRQIAITDSAGLENAFSLLVLLEGKSSKTLSEELYSNVTMRGDLAAACALEVILHSPDVDLCRRLLLVNPGILLKRYPSKNWLTYFAVTPGLAPLLGNVIATDLYGRNLKPFVAAIRCLSAKPECAVQVKVLELALADRQPMTRSNKRIRVKAHSDIPAHSFVFSGGEVSLELGPGVEVGSAL